MANYQVQRQGLNLCDALGYEGPMVFITNACASGANAIGHAWQLLRRGGAERALAGGYDALCHFGSAFSNYYDSVIHWSIWIWSYIRYCNLFSWNCWYCHYAYCQFGSIGCHYSGSFYLEWPL